MKPSIFVLLIFLLEACHLPGDRLLEQALEFAGNNRAELENVLYCYLMIGTYPIASNNS